MPQVDLETLVSACAGGTGDRKIGCETLSDDDDDDKQDLSETNVCPKEDQADNINELPPDFPPESFWLSQDAEVDWMNHNAFFERKESTKGISAHPQTGNSQHTAGSNSNSQRFGIGLPSKSAIIGLPKTQKASFVDAKRRKASKPGNTRLFPKKTGVVGKSVSSLAEPSSPKVSCMGRVRSKRRSRRSTEPFEKSRSGREKKKQGFCSGLMKIFKGKKQRKPGSSAPVQEEEINNNKVKEKEAPRKSLSGSRRAREFSISTEPGVEPPGLGGMKRFSSGRRSTDEFDGVVAGSFDLDRR